ncbi:hypothetical protein LTR85_007018 [Meristemomyces frigidus]|nr:hypothetical protein LTR85_007018 [Meristemomyces frigidus]
MLVACVRSACKFHLREICDAIGNKAGKGGCKNIHLDEILFGLAPHQPPYIVGQESLPALSDRLKFWKPVAPASMIKPYYPGEGYQAPNNVRHYEQAKEVQIAAAAERRNDPLQACPGGTSARRPYSVHQFRDGVKTCLMVHLRYEVCPEASVLPTRLQKSCCRQKSIIGDVQSSVRLLGTVRRGQRRTAC